MKKISHREHRVLRVKKIISVFSVNSVAICFLLFTFAACSIPNLEKPECTEARNAVREFYSFHFGNDLKPSKENLQRREQFLTAALKQKLAAQTDDATDYFTQTDDYPKAFRVGGCEVVNENKTILGIILFWKDDTRSEQHEVKVEAVKQTDKWLIDEVKN